MIYWTILCDEIARKWVQILQLYEFIIFMDSPNFTCISLSLVGIIYHCSLLKNQGCSRAVQLRHSILVLVLERLQYGSILNFRRGKILGAERNQKLIHTVY
jgi:hypothetical protein